MMQIFFYLKRKYDLIRGVMSNLLLLVYFYLRIKKFLDQKNVSNYKIFNFKNWHHGYAYFTAIQSDKKVFIKVDTKLLLLENDLKVYELSKKTKLKKYLIKVCDFIMGEGFQVIVFEYVDGQKLSKHHLFKNKNLIREIEEILRNLDSLDIIHRDIKPDNFLIISDGSLKIIDFTFAVSFNKALKFKDLDLTKRKNCKILESLGAGLNPSSFVWNDFCAFKKMLLSINDDGFFDEYIRTLETVQGKYYTCEPRSWMYCFEKSIKKRVKKFLKIGTEKNCRDIFNEIEDFKKISKEFLQKNR